MSKVERSAYVNGREVGLRELARAAIAAGSFPTTDAAGNPYRAYLVLLDGNEFLFDDMIANEEMIAAELEWCIEAMIEDERAALLKQSWDERHA